MMGGAIGRGNITPAAQFNAHIDPVAFQRVLKNKGEIPLVMIPLEVTNEMRARQKIFQFLKKYDTVPFAQAILKMLTQFKQMYLKYEQFDYPPVHDACVIHYLLYPSDFELKPAIIKVDTGDLSYGRTNIYFNDFRDPPKPVDSIDRVAVGVRNRSKFWRNMEKILTEIFQNPQN